METSISIFFYGMKSRNSKAGHMPVMVSGVAFDKLNFSYSRPPAV